MKWKCYARPAATTYRYSGCIPCGHLNKTGIIFRKLLCCEKCGCTKIASDSRRKEYAMQLTASEAIYAFCAWLTARKPKTIMSSSDDAAPIVELIHTFCVKNKLPEPRNNYTDYFTMPKKLKPNFPCIRCDGDILVDDDKAWYTCLGCGHRSSYITHLEKETQKILKFEKAKEK